ncbi:MAG: methyltransferase domain-containing protein, partial [Candidatus Dormibacteraeota bacterium]|nr:methyltransferase domain-containing protein [Candidatus Dormibacteraeota bacterium]
FADRVFGATLASHVLHLIDPWQPAVDEMVRVTRAGGVLLIDVGGPRSSGWASTGVTQQFWSRIPDGRQRRRLRGGRAVDEEMQRRGFRVRRLPEVVAAHETTIGELIDRLERGTQSACWELDEDVRRQAAAQTREWAIRLYGDLEVRQKLERLIAWQAYERPDR